MKIKLVEKMVEMTPGLTPLEAAKKKQPNTVMCMPAQVIPLETEPQNLDH